MPQHYTAVADLLAEESFINYCKGGPIEDVAKWERFRMESSANAVLVESARRKYMEIFKVFAKADLDEQLNRLECRLEAFGPAPVVPINNLRRQTARRFLQAAVVVIAAGLGLAAFLLLSRKSNHLFTTTIGERKSFHLSDGSFVRLNAGSTLTLCEGFGQSCRDITLEGEAYFEVQHNAALPFIVHTADMDVRAVGTAFNVRSYTEDVSTETSLIKGCVEITLKGARPTRLKLEPSQKITWNNDRKTAIAAADSSGKLVRPLSVTSSGEIKETGWINSKLIFENEPLSLIVVKLERWYGVRLTITDEAIGEYRYTGTFGKEGIAELLDQLKESRPFNYVIVTGEEPAVILSR